MTLLSAWRHLVGYFDGADRRLRLANAVAFVVTSNQPFYPIYVWWIAGRDTAIVSLVTWFSTPFFAAVPGVGRRSPANGKILLLVAGIGNTAICAFALGPTSGVELFYVPCLILAGALFEGRALRISLAVSLTVVAIAMMLAHRATPLVAPTDAATLVRLHAASVVGLVAVIVYRAWRDRRT